MILRKFKTGICLTWSIIFIITYLFVYYFLAQLSKASLYGLFNVFTVDFTSDISNDDLTNRILLENVLDKESELINRKLKIFFIQTSENDDILSRHACSIESAVRLHPNGLIIVLMHSKYINLKKGSYIHLNSYENLYFLHFNEYDIYSGTSLIHLNKTKRQQFLHYFSISHMSDLIRTALLYKYGGIYFDLDVIPLKNFEKFSNTVALETSDTVNVAVLVFEKQHLILDVQMDLQLKSLENKFNDFCWNCLGPLTLTNALKNVCDQHQLSIHNKDKCHQIDIQPSYVFYPIPYQQIPQFFRSSSEENINFLLKNSSIYSIHYFHHMTMNIPIEIHSSFAQIAELYCPNIYQDLLNENISNQSSTYFLLNTNIFFICLFLTFLGFFIFILFAHFLSSFRIIQMILFRLRRKFNQLSF